MKRTLLVALAVAGAACTDTPSTNIRTAGMSANIIGTSDGLGQTELSTELQLSATAFVDLQSPDTLTAKSGADQLTLARSSVFGRVTYRGTLKGDEEGKSIIVALQRGSMDTNAPSSVLSMPAPFKITAPVENSLFIRGKDAITVSWESSGKADPMAISISGNCIVDGSRSIQTDTGSFVFPASAFISSKDHEGKTCDLSISVTRTRKGTVDPAYGGGEVEGIQRRVVQVRSAAQ